MILRRDNKDVDAQRNFVSGRYEDHIEPVKAARFLNWQRSAQSINELQIREDISRNNPLPTLPRNRFDLAGRRRVIDRYSGEWYHSAADAARRTGETEDEVLKSLHRSCEQYRRVRFGYTQGGQIRPTFLTEPPRNGHANHRPANDPRKKPR